MINLNDVLYKEISNRIIENPSNPFESKNILYVILKSNKPFIMIFDFANPIKSILCELSIYHDFY